MLPTPLARLALLTLTAAAGCVGTDPAGAPAATALPGEALVRAGDEISVCGQLFHIGTPVVLWTDPGGYDAYRVEPRFPDEMSDEQKEAWLTKAHYHSVRRHLPEAEQNEIRRDGWTMDRLRDAVDLFVVHYDVCGTSRQCFKVLHDRRYLSVHFMLDVDGTLYQTLDLKERAWHAGSANDRSVGIEIAQIGAYPDPNDPVFDEWYAVDDQGPYVNFPDWMTETGIRTEGFVARPSRSERIDGPMQGQHLHQYDFTDEQYEALGKLLAGLNRVLPRIELDAPRDDDGAVTTTALSEERLSAFSGVIGHHHVTTRKVDPGPAFDWERVLESARAQSTPIRP